MEDVSPFTSLKKTLSSVPAKVLNYSSRIILSNNLDFKQILTSKRGYARDYRGLGEFMDLQHNDIKIFERSKESPTQQILEAWEIKPNATLEKLIEFLEEMERYDIIKELVPSLEKTVKIYLENQRIKEIPIQDPEISSCPVSMQPERELQVFTLDDLKTGECTYYDAYVSYADEDCHFVQDLARILESPDIGLKLFIRGRDLLAGYAEHDTNIMLIKERCRRMLIILSPNFLKSPACEFQASFAAGLAIDQKQRMLIPIVYAPCETPLILKYVSKIDFTKPDVQEWVWAKLISSLLPEDKTSMFTPSLHRIQLQKNTGSNSAPLPSIKTNPMITYPQTSKHIPYTVYNPSISVSSVASIDTTSESALKNTSISAKAPLNSPKWWASWSSHLKGRFSGAESSNHSISSSSSATSGFHSQSGNTFENLASSEEDFPSDTPV